MPFADNNVTSGIPKNDQFQIGRANVDTGSIAERGINLPVASDAAASWVYYNCSVGVALDSGIVVHNRLPQVDNAADTLSVTPFDDPKLDMTTELGVNLRCKDQYQDIVQRMGHARYWFRLWGMGLRVGYQIPIPRLQTIGGVPAIPYDKNPQWAYNSIAPGANYSGVILWRAQWSLWYTVAIPPISNSIPTSDPSAHISGVPAFPKNGAQSPYSQPDDNSKSTRPLTHR